MSLSFLTDLSVAAGILTPNLPHAMRALSSIAPPPRLYMEFIFSWNTKQKKCDPQEDHHVKQFLLYCPLARFSCSYFKPPSLPNTIRIEKLNYTTVKHVKLKQQQQQNSEKISNVRQVP